MKNCKNLPYYLRVREVLSQHALSKKVNLTANDICRIEKGNLGAGFEKFKALAQYFSISIDDLVRNKYENVFATFRQKIKASKKKQRLIKAINRKRDEIGFAGEEYVADLEEKKLKGTAYENAVNPKFAEDVDAHFDILRFDLNGEQIYIEVKSTTGKAGNNFNF